MKIKKELIKREVAGETILVPVGKAALESNGLFLLNGSGAFLWDCLAAAGSEQELLERMLEEYDVDEDTARRDITEFLNRLKEMEIL